MASRDGPPPRRALDARSRTDSNGNSDPERRREGVDARQTVAPRSSAAVASSFSTSSSSANSRSPVVAISPNNDLESLLGWDRRRAAERATSDRVLRDRILSQERQQERERRELLRMAGESRQLADMIRQMMISNAHLRGGGGNDNEDAPPLLDSRGVIQKFRQILRCYSFSTIGKEATSEMGDKILLPPETLYNVQKLRLPFPLLFRVENWNEKERRKFGGDVNLDINTAQSASVGASATAAASSSSSSPIPPQYVGVLEFSAPEEHIYLPSWLLTNLRLAEGDTIRLTSETGTIPPGNWVRLIPAKREFTAILKEMGPKFFLEMALRSYSVLTRGQRIVIVHNNRTFDLHVDETKPANTISLLGNIDLEVEFGIAMDTPPEARAKEEANGGSVTVRGGRANEAEEEMDEDLKRALAMSLAESGSPPAASTSSSSLFPTATSSSSAFIGASPPAATCPSLLNDEGGWSGGASNSPSKSASKSLHERLTAAASALAEAKSKEEVEARDDDIEEEEGDDETVDYSQPLPPNHTLCPTCHKAISNGSYSLHSLHCARAFIKCTICAKMVKKVENQKHTQRHEVVSCDACGTSMERRKLSAHRKKDCTHRAVTCQWCLQPQPLINLPAHESACSMIPVNCEICHQDIQRRNFASHPNSDGCRIQCTQCDSIVPSRDIESHTRSICDGRMVPCPHCKLAFRARETAKHQEYCGSRTEKCDECQRYIKLRDMEMHTESQCALPLVETKSPPLAAAPAASNARHAISSLLPLDSSPDMMSAILAHSLAFEDPLAAAATHNSASTSIAAKQAREAREKLSRAMDAADEVSDEEAWQRGQEARGVVSSKPKANRAHPSRSSPPPMLPLASPPHPRRTVASHSNLSEAATAGSSFTCAYCQDRCATLESLQVHILTECSDAHSIAEQTEPDLARRAIAGITSEDKPKRTKPSASVASNNPPSKGYASSYATSRQNGTCHSCGSTGHRQFECPTRITHPASSNRAVVDLDDDDEIVEIDAPPQRKPATTISTRSVPSSKSTSQAKQRSSALNGSSSSSAIPSRRKMSQLDEYDEPITAYLPGSSSSNVLSDRPSRHSSASSSKPASASSSSSASRNPHVPMKVPLRQQQKDLERAIALRKSDAHDALRDQPHARDRSALIGSSSSSATALSKRVTDNIDGDDDLEVMFPLRSRTVASQRTTSSTSNSSGSSERTASRKTESRGPTSSSLHSGIDSDLPTRSIRRDHSATRRVTTTKSRGEGAASNASDDYEQWLKKNFPATPAASSTPPSYTPVVTSVRQSSRESVGASYSRSNVSVDSPPASPLAAFLGAARTPPTHISSSLPFSQPSSLERARFASHQQRPSVLNAYSAVSSSSSSLHPPRSSSPPVSQPQQYATSTSSSSLLPPRRRDERIHRSGTSNAVIRSPHAPAAHSTTTETRRTTYASRH